MTCSQQSQDSAVAFWRAGGPDAQIDARVRPPAAPDARSADHPLAQVIQSEVIPRLLVAHRTSPTNEESPWHKGGELAAEAMPVPVPDDIAHFARLLLTREISDALSYVDDLVAQGMGFESVYLDLLSPTARFMADAWKSDRRDFVDVTIGLMQLQRVLREMGRAFDNDCVESPGKRRALLCGMPGEQQFSGITRLAESLRRAAWFEFLRRAGWHVVSGPTVDSNRDLEQLVRDDWFAVVGLSVNCDIQVDGLITAVRKIRRASRNQSVQIMVGGAIFDTSEKLAELVGADAVCSDGPGAVVEAESLLRAMP